MNESLTTHNYPASEKISAAIDKYSELRIRELYLRDREKVLQIKLKSVQIAMNTASQQAYNARIEYQNAIEDQICGHYGDSTENNENSLA